MQERKKTVRLNRMVAFAKAAAPEAVAEGKAAPAARTPAQEAAVEALKEALSRPQNDPRRLGLIHDAMYELSKGRGKVEDIETLSAEISAFLDKREEKEIRQSVTPPGWRAGPGPGY